MAEREEASGSQTLHQRNVVQNRDPGPSQEGFRGRVEEILVPCAKNLRFADYGCLHYYGIVPVPNRSDQQRIRMNNLGGLAKEANVVVDAAL